MVFSAQAERKYTDFLAEYDRDIGACYTVKEKLLKEYENMKAETKTMEVRSTSIFNA